MNDIDILEVQFNKEKQEVIIKFYDKSEDEKYIACLYQGDMKEQRVIWKVKDVNELDDKLKKQLNISI